MAKFDHVDMFGEMYGVPDTAFERAGILNPSLNVDTKLFIDAVLYRQSAVSQFSSDAVAEVAEYFENLLFLLESSSRPGDQAWEAAKRLIGKSETPYLCLGYGSSSTTGSSLSEDTIDGLLSVAKQVIELGLRRPEIFYLMPLFQDGVGPDTLSDISAKASLNSFVALTQRLCSEWDIPMAEYALPLLGDVRLPVNRSVVSGRYPLGMPVLLTPQDVLRKLPVATSKADLMSVTSFNDAFRYRINRLVADLWSAKTKKQKAEARATLLSDPNLLNRLMDRLSNGEYSSYDFTTDPEGEVFWKKLLSVGIQRYGIESLSIESSSSKHEHVFNVAAAVVKNFQFLIEERRLSEELWVGNQPRHEKSAQRLLFTIAFILCKLTDVDVTPEGETGSGPVDFKFSSGFSSRVPVELKLSTNAKAVHGFEVQLATYMRSEGTKKGIFILIDVGKLGNKWRKIVEMYEASPRVCEQLQIVLIDGKKRPSASVR